MLRLSSCMLRLCCINKHGFCTTFPVSRSSFTDTVPKWWNCSICFFSELFDNSIAFILQDTHSCLTALFPGLPLSFYRLDALPAAQPTVPKHWRHKHWRHILQDSILKLNYLQKYNNQSCWCGSFTWQSRSMQLHSHTLQHYHRTIKSCKKIVR